MENPDLTNVLLLRVGVGQNIAMHASPTAGNFFLVPTSASSLSIISGNCVSLCMTLDCCALFVNALHEPTFTKTNSRAHFNVIGK